MKLFERHDTEKTIERLPDLPPDVEVPDDISGLRDSAMPRPTTRGIRWMRWVAGIALLAGAGVLAAALLRSDDAAETPVDLMEVYGTDNPTVVDEAAVPGTVEIVADVDYMGRFGTDNPVFVPQAEDVVIVDPADYMEVYGTDNPTVVDEGAVPGTVEIVAPQRSSMELYGTDNPVIVPGAPEADSLDTGELLRRYGTDNPVFTPEPTFMELYGTDNPVIVEP